MNANRNDERCHLIKDYIHANRAIIFNDLQEIVAINSPSLYAEGNNAVIDFLEARLRHLGMACIKIEGNPFGTCLLAELHTAQKTNILFCGHTDTVFPLGTEWPFSFDSRRAYGPGVIDMKSGLISLVYALQALKETGEMPTSVKIFFNTDEEEGSPVSRKLLPDIIKGIDFAYILEPAEPDGRIITRRKGIGKFTISVLGRAAHAGKSPETGVNAILELANQIIYIEGLANGSLGTTMNTGLIEGGASAFIVPESARAVIESRVFSKDEQERIEKELHSIAMNNTVAGTTITVSGHFHRPPLIEQSQTRQLITAVETAAETLGIDIEFGMSGAASDGNNISAMGIPVIDGMGPVGGREHSSDEYLEIETLYERSALLACSLLTLNDYL